jgi:hypothetical protein
MGSGHGPWFSGAGRLHALIFGTARRRASLLALWIAAVLSGMALMVRYGTSAGSSPGVLAAWPDGTKLRLDPRVPTLLMMAHPRCPCTRASVREFAKLVSRCRDRVSAHVMFFEPEGGGPEWSGSDLWRSASQIPGVTVHADPDGSAARLLGAQTSGTVFVFAPDGRGLFVGGITALRGHEGDNAGSDAAREAVLYGRVQPVGTVFGCPICEPGMLGEVSEGDGT